MDLQRVNPLEPPDWDGLLLQSGDTSFFHTAAWARVLVDSYGYKPVYFVGRKDGRLSLVMPFMDVASRLTGRRGVSLPFTDSCDPFGPDSELLRQAVRDVIDYGQRAKWRYAEWRTVQDLVPEAKGPAPYLIHNLDLVRGETEILAGLHENHRRNIRKAEKAGLTMTIDRSRESLGDFYRLHCRTRRKHGLPPQPLMFFKKIFEHVLSRDLGIIVSAHLSGKAVASSVFFHFGPNAIFKYGASDSGYLALRPNNLVMWEAVKWFKRRGAKDLDLGRTELDDRGLRRFKLGWGASESALSYYRYDLEREAFIRSPLRGNRPKKIFTMIPVGVLRLIARLGYRHIG